MMCGFGQSDMRRARVTKGMYCLDHLQARSAVSFLYIFDSTSDSELNLPEDGRV